MTILLVDDDKPVLDTTKTILKMSGYQVITADDGFSAIEVYKMNQDEIDLVILDYSMPRMSGKETLQGLLEINPGIKVIVSSGFDRKGPVKELLEMGAVDAVQKPFRMKTLIECVKSVMEGADL